MNVLAIIPARGGSKGIPRKNIVPVAGKPLLAWTIEAAQKSKFINMVTVSSDSDEILGVAKRYGAIPLRRPSSLATDNAPSGPVIMHAIESLRQKSKYMPDIVVLLQPTSPLRTHLHIDEAISVMLRKKCSAVISVKETDKMYLKTFVDKNGYLAAAVNENFPFTPRQKLPSVYVVNGAIFATLTREFLKTKKLLTGKTTPYIMDEECSLDLDTLDDLHKLRCIMSQRSKNKKPT